MSITRLVRRVIALGTAIVVGACSSAPPPARPVFSPITERAAPETLPGKIVWHDLLTHDTEAAQEFYGDLFGWSFENSREAPGRYWDIKHEGRTIASMLTVARDEVESPLWLVSVSVADVDGAASRASKLGATITAEPSELPNRGRYAVLEDLQGAFLVLLRSSSGDPPDGGEVASGAWLWSELWTTDAAAAVSFYEGLLGYRSKTVAARLADTPEDASGESVDGEESPAVFYAMYRDDSVRAGIHQLPSEAVSYWLPYVAVRDVSGMAARAEELGGKVLLPPEAVRNGEAAILVDPTGAPFGIQEWPRAEGGDR
ncbi:MAG: VOC family protein [Gemmatimonadota bacterium]